MSCHLQYVLSPGATTVSCLRARCSRPCERRRVLFSELTCAAPAGSAAVIRGLVQLRVAAANIVRGGIEHARNTREVQSAGAALQATAGGCGGHGAAQRGATSRGAGAAGAACLRAEAVGGFQVIGRGPLSRAEGELMGAAQ